jgi:hypothetical protein
MNNHFVLDKTLEIELRIPRILAVLERKIFENLPLDLAEKWRLRFLESIKVDIDLSKVWPKFAIFLLTDPSQCNLMHPQCQIIVDHFKNELDGKIINWPEVVLAAHAAPTVKAAYAAYANATVKAAKAAYGAPTVKTAATVKAAYAYAAYAAVNAAAGNATVSPHPAAHAAAIAAATYAAAHAAAIAAATYATEDDRTAYRDAHTAAFTGAYVAQSEKLLQLLRD